MTTQIIELNGKPAFAVVPMSEWTALLQRLEELQDIADARASSHEETFPLEFMERLLSGESPLKVWREYRGFTLQVLGDACGCSRQMISMIEHGKSKPSADLLARLADALNCEMDELLGGGSGD